MRKILTIIIVIVALLGISSVYAKGRLNIINKNSKVVYILNKNVWATGGISTKNIVLTKKTACNSGIYSEYYYQDGNLALVLNSDFEFLQGGKLIAVDNDKLKYFQVIYENEMFDEVMLSDEDIKKIFPSAEIVRLSQFENNEYTIKKGLLTSKNILLLNDLNNECYKVISGNNTSSKNFSGYLTLSERGKVELQQIHNADSKLTLIVR